MLDVRSITSLCMLMLNYGIYTLYLYEQFWGDWEPIHAKAIFYFGTAFVLLYFIFDELRGYNFLMQYHIKICYLISLVITFVLFYLILDCKLPSTRGVLVIVYAIMLILITAAILYHGIKNRLFKHT